MKNLTISLDEQILLAGRAYAKAHHTSLNNLLRSLLKAVVTPSSAKNWTSEFFALADRAQGNSGGERWKREDLYDV